MPALPSVKASLQAKHIVSCCLGSYQDLMLVSFLSGPCDVSLTNSDEIDIA